MAWFRRARKRHRILILGRSDAGKTTLLYRLANQPVPDNVVPTATPVLGKALETPKGFKFIYSEQKQASNDASAIIYVITRDNLEAGIADIQKFLRNDLQPQIPLIILVNKQELADTDGLDEVAISVTPVITSNRPWAVIGCSAKTVCTGITEWLETQLPQY